MAEAFPAFIRIECDDCGQWIEKGSPALFNVLGELVHEKCPDPVEKVLLTYIQDALLTAPQPVIEVLRAQAHYQSRALEIRLGDGSELWLTLVKRDGVRDDG